jgi:adhesin/invasin
MMGAAAILVSCASDSLTLPGEGEPAFVIIENGNGQEGTAGRMLTDSLVVTVTDGESRPVVSRTIAFSVSGGGVVQPASVATNGEGKAVFRWVLGPGAGQQSLEAGLGSSGQLEPKVTFLATAVPGPVQAMDPMGGDGQSAPAGTPLPSPLVVRLQDSFGNGVAGARVSWQVSDGMLSQSTSTTGDDGAASVVWTLGSSVGQQTATASFEGANGSPTTFTATATQGASPRLAIVTQPSAQVQSGQPFSRQPSVRLETAGGSAIAMGGVSITAAIASGGGTLSGTTTVSTNSSGVAQFEDLAITGSNGTRTLIFAAVNRTPAVSGGINVITPGPSADQTTAHVPNGKPFKWTTITITTRYDSGQPLDQGGYASLIKVSVSGSNTNSSLTVFDNGDGTYEASYFPIFKGNDDITITLNGVPIQGSPFRSKVK